MFNSIHFSGCLARNVLTRPAVNRVKPFFLETLLYFWVYYERNTRYKVTLCDRQTWTQPFIVVLIVKENFGFFGWLFSIERKMATLKEG